MKDQKLQSEPSSTDGDPLRADLRSVEDRSRPDLVSIVTVHSPSGMRMERKDVASVFRAQQVCRRAPASSKGLKEASREISFPLK